MTTYKIGLTGESNYQDAIGRCAEGQAVDVLHEIGNPYDAKALVVVSRDGRKIGYVPKSNWFQGAAHDEGKGCAAVIKSIDDAGRGLRGVVIEIDINFDGVGECAYPR